MWTTATLRYLFLLVLVLCGGACQSTDVLTPKKPEPPADAPNEQPQVLERDNRPEDDNVLALLEMKTDEVQALRRENAALRRDLDEKTAGIVAAGERENRLVQDLERIESLLKETTAKRRELEEQVLRARLETVRAERELYKAQIDALATAPVK